MACLLCLYRNLHTVRPHVPSIHFPKRFPLGKLTFSGEPSTFIPETNINYGTKEPKMGNVDTTDDSELPIRYRRTIILPEEIIYIERGGPD